MSDLQNLVIAAVNAVGSRSSIDPNGPSWETQVIAAAEDIVMLSNPEGKVAKALELVKTLQPFTAIVAAVGFEESSKRGFIGLASKSSDPNKGAETIRTDRVDSSGNAQQIIDQLAQLRGHRVLIWKRNETMKDGRKVRVLHRFEDLGHVGKDQIDEVRDKLREAASMVAESATVL